MMPKNIICVFQVTLNFKMVHGDDRVTGKSHVRTGKVPKYPLEILGSGTKN